MKITDRLLRRYNESDYIIRQKARFLFFVYAVLIISVVCIMAYTTYFQLNNPLRNNEVDQRMLGVACGALLLVISCLVILVRSHFSAAAHGTLIGLFIALWSAMVLDRTEIVSRLNTIVLVMAVLSSMPLLISRKRWAILLYSALNLAAFYAYMFYLRGGLGLSETAFYSHLADNTIAFLFIGIISYNIFSINNNSLERAEESNEKLRKANMELQATMEELETTSEEFEAQNEELLRSEEELKRNTIFIRRIVENAPAIINRYSLIENRFEFVSPRVRDLGGYSPEEFYTDPDILKKFVHPDWFKRVMKWWGGLVRGTSSPAYEYQIRKKDGTDLWVREHSQLITDKTGRPVAIEGFTIDIDDIRKSETRLKESEEKYRGLVENINDIIFTADAQGRITYLSPSVGRYGDFGADDFIGKPILDVIHPEDREKLVQRFGELSEGGLAPSEYRIVFPPGQFRWARVSTRPVFTDGAFAGASGVISDIHERKLAEQSLAEEGLRVDRQRAALAALSNDPALFAGDTIVSLKKIAEEAAAAMQTRRVGFWLLSDDGEKLRCVDLYEADVRSHSAGAVLEAGEYPRYFEAIKKYSRISAPDACSHPHTSEFIDSYLVPLGITSMLDAGISIEGKLVGVVCFEHTGEKREWHPDDESFASTIASIVTQLLITAERKQAEEALRESEEKLRTLVENISEVLYSADKDGKLTYISPSAERMGGYRPEELIGADPFSFIHPDDLGTMEEDLNALRDGTIKPSEYRVRTKSGDYRWIMSTSRPVIKNGQFMGSSGVFTDITERKTAELESERIQRQLLQAQKMEAVGTLAGGIAHDFNNMLGGIMGSLNLIELLLRKEGPLQVESLMKYVDTALESSSRAAEMTKQLLTLSRKSELKLAPVDVTLSLKHVLKLCQNSFPKSVELDFHIGEKPLRVQADPLQLEQVMLNLCINASHAMTIMRPERSRHGGVLTVQTGKVDCDRNICVRHPNARPGILYIMIRVSDTGVGMDEETRRQIFDPFFTTKKQQEGTGLGLAIAYGIVEQHGGFIDVYSEPGKGSAFNVYIPALTDMSPEQRPGAARANIITGSGKILVIDDENAILHIARGMLEQCGYEVLTAPSGHEGIEIYMREHASIDGVLLDLAMPGMSGLELFKYMKEIHPGVRVLLSSGLMESEDVRTAMALGVRGFLQKPYSVEELSLKMKEVLG